MILLLDTSTPTCRLTLIERNQRYEYEWLAERTLANGLLEYIKQKLGVHGRSLHDLTGIGVFRGPGSFTGLRIGLTVCNTLADALTIPIIGDTGGDWQAKTVERLNAKQSDYLILPSYGRDAHITKPRK